MDTATEIIPPAFECLKQDVSVFQQIVAPLRNCLNLSFGHILIFQDGRYYILHDDLVFLKDFTGQVDKCPLLSGEQVMSALNNRYRFTLWPENTLNEAFSIFRKHNQHDGVSLSVSDSNCTRIYWFASKHAEKLAQKFLILNKDLLIKFIYYFNCHLPKIFNAKQLEERRLFKFKNTGDLNIPSTSVEISVEKVQKFLGCMSLSGMFVQTLQGQARLSSKEINVLSLFAHGYTMKVIARKVNIAPKTVQNHIDNIRAKVHLRSKDEIVNFYHDKLSGVFE